MDDIGGSLSGRPPCWGIGLGRTGTSSFCQALRILGYANVGHNPAFEELRALSGGADNGVTIHYKYLDYKFPGSKFVLMTRALPQWLDSMDYIAEKSPVISRDQDLPILRRMTLYETVNFDREKFTDAYHRHHADVRRYFARRPGDLLELKITEGEGWERLCPFLGLAVPPQAFPHNHSRGQRTACARSNP